MAKVDKSCARLTKVLAEKFGKLIHDAPNEAIRAKLRKCNAFGKHAKDALAGVEIPEHVAQRMYELINKCINDWSDQYVNAFYDALIQEDVEEKQMSLELETSNSEETVSETETLELVDDNGVKHTVVVSNKPYHYVVIMRPDGSYYQQEVDADTFDLKDFESRLSIGYAVIQYV
jgi:hypothetical protein